nr:PREDICTED: probable DNA-3-methyladenine glycosylase 2 isoform X1 [Daucus carota subsp. sativus]
MENQNQPNSLSQLHPNPTPLRSIQTIPVNLPPIPDLKHHSNPSKIPIRPPKARRLSSPDPSQPTIISPDPTSTNSTEITNSTTSTTTVTNSTAITTTKQTTGRGRRGKEKNQSQAPRDYPQIIKPLTAPGELENALRHLRNADPLLANLIDTHPPPAFESHHSPFLSLARSILYQQLAYKAGTSIYSRFVELCGGEEAVLPDVVLSLTAQQLKQIGVSGRKASYLYDLASKYKSGILSDETVVRMDDKSLFTMLSMVKGIGSWSVHMFMIFSLHRPDVLPISDLGVRKGIHQLFGLEELPRPSQMEQLCEKWRPYRSVGAWYMWRFVESKGAPSPRLTVAVDGEIHQQQQLEQQQHQLQLLEPINGIGNLGISVQKQKTEDMAKEQENQ